MNSGASSGFAYVFEKSWKPLKPRSFTAAFGLRDGPARVAEPQASHRCELARVLLDNAGEEVVDADSPIVGLGAAEEFRAGDAVGEHGEVHAHGVHRSELGLDLAVSGRGDDAIRR